LNPQEVPKVWNLLQGTPHLWARFSI
jgi:hypothetical protein